ncbi:hypothetical protein TCAL_03255 [Tigriopus californicus]|uniref:C2H2-type domain-containing protein n=1 Tax=Tigriopus californicus TaxID=6832 RepID=A0A553NVM1_TIGCA|nr:zinc finger protein 687a-like [Tigriopus californicus]TRY69472.1 hypothetical protein TCAL_03255 [Tigriopus californicus]|eukprot:TCALIF_03255-PA protein Name:"Similar to Znf592 Zinc finger protein 592 (Mus musculus)" AED:0.18 eAED:0.20 QI:0/-1/0/1/-1/1/1/0/1014
MEPTREGDDLGKITPPKTPNLQQPEKTFPELMKLIHTLDDVSRPSKMDPERKSGEPEDDDQIQSKVVANVIASLEDEDNGTDELPAQDSEFRPTLENKIEQPLILDIDPRATEHDMSEDWKLDAGPSDTPEETFGDQDVPMAKESVPEQEMECQSESSHVPVELGDVTKAKVRNEQNQNELVTKHSQASDLERTGLCKEVASIIPDHDTGPSKLNNENVEVIAQFIKDTQPEKKKPLKLKKTGNRQSKSKKVAKPLQNVDFQKKRGVQVKPIQNWRKVIKFPQSTQERQIHEQLFKSPLPTYIPCVPKGTSQRLIATLSAKDVEQLCCPGCKDRFLLPHTFFQHVYRKSIGISFNCQLCQKRLSFNNHCHLKMHVMSHLENDGVSVVASEGVNIVPLGSKELQVGFFDDNCSSELDNVYRETFRNDPNMDQCSECRLSIEKNQLQAHFLLGNVNFFKECGECSQVLPNQCSLSAHERIHRREKPYSCPECGTDFQTWNTFQHHVQKSCLHEYKVWTFECKLCVQKGVGPSEALIKAQNLVGHVIDHHIKLYYKCTSCSKAFDSKDAIYKHRDEVHGASTNHQADFSILYKANFLRKNNIFMSIDALERKMETLSRDWFKDFVFQCPSCCEFFEDGPALDEHNAQWCQMQQFKENENWCRSKLFPPPKDAKLTEKKLKLEECWRILQEICPKGCAQCHETLVTLKGHLGTHLDLEGSNLELTAIPPPSLLSPMVERRVSSVHSEPDEEPPEPKRRKTRSAVAANLESPRLSNPEPLEPQAPVAEPEIECPKQILLPAVEVKSEALESPKPLVSIKDKRSPAFLLKKKIKSKIAKKSEIKPFVESLGLDMPSSRNLMAINRLSKKALAVGSSVSDTKNSTSNVGNHTNMSKFKCALCDFDSEFEDSFVSHIRIHRPSNVDIGDYFQCKQCGMCFASEPAWRKHLFLLHRIKRPDPEDYCEPLEYADDGPSDIVQNEPALKPRQNVCQVCSKAFASPVELRRHFRSHGMAFLQTGVQ